MATEKEKKDNEVTIKVETGGEEKKESSTGGSTGGNQPQQPAVQVKPDPLGYAEQRAAAATGVPAGAPAVDLMNPVATANHPQVDLMNPGPTEPVAATRAKEALGRQISTPLPQKDAYQEGYDAQQQLDWMAEFAKMSQDQQGVVDNEQQKLDTMVAEDETAQRNERSRKVIAGLGDAISSVVNLVGTMNGAYDQKQVFMEPRLRDVVEQDRQRRYARIEKQRANLQQQINILNNMRASGAKMDAANRQAAANVALKQAEMARKAENDQRNWELNNWKAQTQYDLAKEKNETNAAIQQARLEEQNRHNKASEAQGWARTNSYVERNNNLNKGGSGGSGRGSGSTKEYMYYDEFREELVKGRGYSSWEDAVRSPKQEDRMLINSLKNATTPNDQQGVIDTYYTRTPNWTQKYRGVGQQAPAQQEQTPAEDDNTPPSMRAAQQQAADDDNTPPSRRNRR